MEVTSDIATLRQTLAPHRRAGETIGLVPTMGALHEGHLALVDAAAAGCDVVVASIFVNPLQFGPDEDFERYPRDLEGDAAMLAGRGVGYVFTPTAETFTPPGRQTSVVVRGVSRGLEGERRPGHFEGVTTIVTKLLNAVGPDRAYFGEKDFQQLVVIRTMVRDLDQPVEVVGCPTVREPDGLAMSSRNAYLSPSERVQATAVWRALSDAARRWDGDADSAREHLRLTLDDAPGVRLDYAEVVDPETLEPIEGVVRGPAQALVAAHVGTTRLIDNIRLELPSVDHGAGD